MAENKETGQPVVGPANLPSKEVDNLGPEIRNSIEHANAWNPAVQPIQGPLLQTESL